MCDICRSTAMTRAVTSERPKVRGTGDGTMERIKDPPLASRGQLVLFSSAGRNQQACEMVGRDYPHGVFSWYLAAALDNPHGANTNNDNYLSAQELFLYAQSHTEKYVYDTFHGMEQVPLPSGEDYMWIANEEILRAPVQLPEVDSETKEYRVGNPFSYSIYANGSPDRYRATNLPDGLSLNQHTGEITGKIDEDNDDIQSVYKVKIGARNGAGWGEGILTIRVRQARKPTPTPTPEPTDTPDPVTPAPSRYPTQPQPQPQPPTLVFIFRGNKLVAQGGVVYAPNGTPLGKIGPSQIQQADGTIFWSDNTVSFFRNDGAIVSMLPNGVPRIDGRWK